MSASPTIVRCGEFFGRSQRKWSSGGLHVEISDFDHGLVVPRHQHTKAYLCSVISGVCEERETTHDRTLDTGSVTLYAPGAEHSDRWVDPGQCLLIEIDEELWKRLAEFGPLPSLVAGHAACSSIANRLHREIARNRPCSLLACEGLIIWLLAEMAHPVADGRRPPRWLARAREILAEAEPRNVSLIEVASTVGVHPAHLSAQFKRHYGETVSEFVSNRRLEYAVRLLGDESQSIGDVATEAGYADQSHFCRAFGRRFGMPPGRYRRSNFEKFKPDADHPSESPR